jgi:Protein of unknown function (DUF3293)
VPLAPDDPWAGYERLVVTISRPGEGDLVIRSAARGQAGRWPFASLDPIVVLTAWDPGGARPGEGVNRRREAQLEAELLPVTRAMWPARGVDPATGARDEGVALQGMAEREARAIAARYGQDAVFVWTPESWSIVACAGGRRVVSGWAVEDAAAR